MAEGETSWNTVEMRSRGLGSETPKIVSGLPSPQPHAAATEPVRSSPGCGLDDSDPDGENGLMPGVQRTAAGPPGRGAQGQLPALPRSPSPTLPPPVAARRSGDLRMLFSTRLTSVGGGGDPAVGAVPAASKPPRGGDGSAALQLGHCAPARPWPDVASRPSEPAGGARPDRPAEGDAFAVEATWLLVGQAAGAAPPLPADPSPACSGRASFAPSDCPRGVLPDGGLLGDGGTLTGSSAGGQTPNTSVELSRMSRRLSGLRRVASSGPSLPPLLRQNDPQVPNEAARGTARALSFGLVPSPWALSRPDGSVGLAHHARFRCPGGGQVRAVRVDAEAMLEAALERDDADAAARAAASGAAALDLDIDVDARYEAAGAESLDRDEEVRPRRKIAPAAFAPRWAWSACRRVPFRPSEAHEVMSPGFSLESTEFFLGKHIIHFLVFKIKDFRDFVLHKCMTLNKFT